MSQEKTSKRTLYTNVFILLICISMLILATYAWFTDSASTGKNKIQAGSLDIELLDENNQSLEGQVLTWQTADGRAQEAILWEPGASYTLQSFKIKNKGNLALKYKIKVSGVVGDATLLNAIDFNVTGMDSISTPEDLDNTEGSLGADQETGLITISATMKSDAGNEYQGETIEGVAITVVATQASVEQDGTGSDYDSEASYPLTSSEELQEALQGASAGDVINLMKGSYSLSDTAIPEGVSIIGSGAGETTLVTSANGYTVTGDYVTIKNLTLDGTAASGVYYGGAINLKGDGAVLEDSVVTGGGTETWGASVAVSLDSGETAYIHNTTISGGFRGIFLGSQNGSVVVDGCSIDAVYPISTDGGGDYTVTVSNSDLHGWTSYSTCKSASFTNTSFSLANSGYDVVAAYTDTTFDSCTFDAGFKIYAQTGGFTFNFNNCVKDGTAVTAENFKMLFPDDSDVWTACTCYVNGVQVTA